METNLQKQLMPITQLSLNDVAALVTKTFLRKNRETSEINIKFTTSELYNSLQKDYRKYNLTFGDIDTAFLNGVLGRYGEVFEISYVSFISWIDKYINSDEYLEKNEKKVIIALPQKTEETDNEKKLKIANFIFNKYCDYKETGKFSDIGNVSYDFLTENRLLIASPEERIIAFNQSYVKKTKRDDGLTNYIEKVMCQNTEKIEKIRIAKNMLVEKFFDKIIKQKKEQQFIDALNLILKKG